MNTTTAQIVQTVNEEFNFSIDKFPLAGPDGLKTPLYALFRGDNGECISTQSVTKQYVPHTTDDVVALAEAASEVFENDVDIRCHFNRGHYLDVKPTKAERRAVFGTADNVIPRFLISASYNGKAFRASLGYYRDLCMNMSMLRMVKGTTTHIRHTTNLRPCMKELIEQFNVLKESWADLTTVIDNMQSREVLVSSFLSEVYGEPPENGRGRTQHENRTEAIVRRVLSERARSGRLAPSPDSPLKVSVWEIFNGVQGYTQHDATRKGSPSDFERIIAANDDRYVKQAEQTAMALLA